MLWCLEPADLMGHLIECFFEHDSLHDNLYDVACDEDLPKRRSVNPLVALLSTSQYGLVVPITTPNLHSEVGAGKNRGKADVKAKLAAEHGALKVSGVLLKLPVILGFYVSFLILIAIVVNVLDQGRSGHVCGDRLHCAESFQGRLFVAAYNDLEDPIEKEKAGCEVHDIRVHLLISAQGSECWDKGQQAHSCVEAVHKNEVCLGAATQGSPLHCW